MSETQVQPVQLPSSEDIRKINAQLREDVTAEVRSEVADRLVLLAAREPHPRAKAAMFERAARLVADVDAERSVFLLRESFRHFPDVEVGQRLGAAGDEDPTLRRLGRMSALHDSIAAIAEDDQTRRDLLIGAAHYHVDRGHGTRALAALEKVTHRDDDAGDIEELRRAAQACIEAREETLQASRMRIVEASDATRGMALLEYARTLLEGDEPLEDASAVLADAADDGGDLQETAPLWAEVARAVGEPEMLARALAACLTTAQAEHERVRVADELVNLPGVDERNPQLAQAALQTLVSAMPDDAGLRARLLAARSAGGDPTADQDLDRMRLDAVRNRDRDTEAVVCLALAKVAARHKDVAKVERYLRRVRTLDPRNSEALDFFENRYREQEDHKRLYLVLTHRLAISQGEELVRIALEMAQLAEGPMANEERAIEAYGRVLSVHPNHRSSLEALERLYRATRRWTAVRDLLDRRAQSLGSHTGATPEALREGRTILEQLAAMHQAEGQLPDTEALFETYRRLHAVAPENAEAADFLIERYRRNESWRPLASVLEARVEHAEDAEVRAACARELYGVYFDKLDDPARARAALARATENSPEDRETLEVLAAAHANAGEMDKLQSVRTKLVALLEGDEKVALLEQAAAWAAENDSDQASAVALYEQLLAAAPAHLAARRGLTRLYAERGQHQMVVDLIDRRLSDETLEHGEKVALLELASRTRADELGDLEGAEASAALLRAIAPDSEQARTVAARAMLARMEFDGLRQLHGEGAAGALAYVQQLQAHLAALPASARALAQMAAAEAQAQELADQRAAANSAHGALLTLLEAEDEVEAEQISATAQGLLLYGEAAGDLDLQSIAVATLVEHSEGELQRMFMAQRVALCEERGDEAGAFGAMTALLSARMVAGDVQGIEGAAERFCDLSELAGAEDEVPALLASWAEMLTIDGEDEPRQEAAIGLWSMSARQTLLRGGQLADALACVDLALELRPAEADLWILREQVCSDMGQWAEVVTSLERRAALLPTEGRLDVLLRAASLCDGAVEDPARAEALYRAIIAERPASEVAWAGLLAQLRHKGDRAALGEALDQFLALPDLSAALVAAASRDRVDMLLHDGANAEAVLTAARPALDGVELAAEPDAAHVAVIDALLAKLELAEDAETIAEALMPALRKLERHADLLTCHRKLAGSAKEGSDAHVGRLLDMARIAQTGLSDAERAWRQLREALVAAPGHEEAWNRISALAAEDGRTQALYAVLAALCDAGADEDVQAIEDAAIRHTVLSRWSAFALDRGDTAAAIQALTLLHNADPKDIGSLEMLESLYREQQDHDAVAFVLSERLQADPSHEDNEGVWLRLADLHLSERQAPEEALEALQEATIALPESEAIAAMRLQLLRDHGEPAALRLALQARIDALADAEGELLDLRLVLQRETAILEQESLRDLGAALRHWLELLQVDPADDQAAECAFELALRLGRGEGEEATDEEQVQELQAVLGRRGDHERVDALLTLRIEASQGDATVSLLREQASRREAGLGAPALAFESLARALALRPGDSEIASEIDRIAANPQDAPLANDVAAAFANAAARCDPGALRRDLRARAAALYERAEDGQAGAIEVYRAMLDDDPRDTHALGRLDVLLAQSGDDRARMAVLEARARTSEDPAEALAMSLEHARLATRIGDDDAAIGAWERVGGLQDQEARAEAATALIELHERRGDSEAQAYATLMLRDLAPSDEGKLGLTLVAADLFAQAGCASEALEALREAERLSPESPAVYAALEERLRSDADGPALVEHLHLGWTRVYATDPDFKDSRVTAALGQLEAMDTLGAPAAGRLSALCAMLDAGLQDEGLRAALSALTQDEDDAVAAEAAERAVALHEANGDRAGAAMARLDRLARFPDRPHARSERAAVAVLLEQELGDAEAALAQWQVLVAADPRDRDAVGAMWRLADATGAGAEADGLVLDALAAVDDATERGQVRLALATRWADAGRVQEALDLLDELLFDDAHNAQAYALRGKLLSGRDDAADRARLLAHHQHGVAHATDPAARRLASTLLAELHLELGEPQAAFDAIATEIEATESPAQKADLYRLAEAFGDEAGLAEPLWTLLTEELEAMGEHPEAGLRHAALAARLLQDPTQHAGARAHAQAALALGGQASEAALETLVTVHEAGQVTDDALLELLVTQLAQTRPEAVEAWLRAAAQAAQAKPRQVWCWESMASLAASDAGRAAGLDAFEPLAKLARALPHEEPRWAQLEATAGEDRREEVIAALVAAWDETEDPKLQSALMGRAARLSEEAGDAETSATYLRMALEANEDEGMRRRLRRLLTSSGAFDAVAVELESQAERDQTQRSALLEEALGLWLDKVGDADQGLRVLDALVALHPERVDLQDRRLDVLRLQDEGAWAQALEVAIAAAREGGDQARVVRLLPGLVDLRWQEASPQAVLAWLLEMQQAGLAAEKTAPLAARLLERLDALDDAQAMTVLDMTLAGTDPALEPDIWMIASLQRVDRLQDEQAQVAALEALSLHARQHMNDGDLAVEWLARAHLLQTANLQRALALADLADNPLRLETAMPVLHTSLHDERMPAAERAQLAGRLLQLGSNDSETWQTIEVLCNDAAFCLPAVEALVPVLTASGQHGRASELRQRALVWLPEEARTDAVIELGRAMAEGQGQAAAAVQLMLDHVPEVEQPLALLEAACDLARDHDRLLDWLEGVELLIAGELLAGDTAMSAVGIAAGVAAAELSDPGRAAELWARAWDLDPDSDDARDAVLALRREAGDAEALAVDLDRALLQTDPEEAVDLRLELAQLCLDRLGRPEETLHQVRTVLRDQEGHEGATALVSRLADHPEFALAALEILEPIHRQAGNWAGLAAVLERQIADRPAGPEVAKVLRQLAELQQGRLDQPAQALSSLLRLLEISPEGPLVERAAGLAAELGDQSAAGRVWELALDGRLPQRDREGVLAAAGRWYRDQGDDARAESVWSELVGLSALYPEAWEGLDAIYDEAGRWGELVSLLERRAEITTDRDLLRGVLHRLGGIAQASDRGRAAVKAYERLAKLDRDDPDPAQALVELLRVLGPHAELADALHSLAGRLTEDEARSRLLCEAARLHLDRLGNADMAAELYHRAFELSPSSDEAFVFLERRWQSDAKKLMRLYRHRAGGVPVGPSRTLVLRKLATVCSGLGRHSEARAALDKAQASDPGNPIIDEALLEICLVQGDYPGYLEAADRRLASQMGRVERIALLRAVVQLCVEREIDTPKYVQALGELVPDDPELPVIAAMMMARSEDPEQAAEGLERVIQETEEPERQIPLLERISALYAGPLENPRKAIAALQRILLLDPDHWEANRGLCALYEQRGSHEARVECLRKWLPRIAEADKARVPVLAGLGEALLHLERTDEAQEAFEQAFALDTEDLRVNRNLALLWRDQGDLARASDRQGWVVEHLRRSRQREELPAAATLAGAMLEALGQHEEARRMFRMALGADPRLPAAILGLARTSLALKDVGRAMAEFEKVAHHMPEMASTDEQAEAELGLGRCWRQRGKRQQARASFNRAIELKPGMREAIEELSKV